MAHLRLTFTQVYSLIDIRGLFRYLRVGSLVESLAENIVRLCRLPFRRTVINHLRYLLKLIEPEYLEWPSKAFQTMKAHHNGFKRFGEAAFEAFGVRYNFAKAFTMLDLHLSLDTDDNALIQGWTSQVI